MECSVLNVSFLNTSGQYKGDVVLEFEMPAVSADMIGEIPGKDKPDRLLLAGSQLYLAAQRAGAKFTIIHPGNLLPDTL